MTLSEFIKEHNITMIYETCDFNPNRGMWIDRTYTHYICTFKKNNELFSCYFSTRGEEPTIIEVLECLGIETSFIESTNDYKEWANEFGYDDTSLKVQNLYNVSVAQANTLYDWFGKAYKTFIDAAIEDVEYN